MPDIRCSDCGRYVRVQGLAATCPYCGNLVMVTHQPASEAPPDPAPPVASIERWPYRGPVELPIQVQPVAVEPLPTRIIWRYAIGATLILVGLVVIVDWIRLRATRNATPVASTTPPPALVAPAP